MAAARRRRGCHGRSGGPAIRGHRHGYHRHRRPFCNYVRLLQHGELPFSFRNMRRCRRSRNVGESLQVWGVMRPDGGRRRVIYCLLSELEIGRDGRLLDMPGGHTLIVLAALLVNANRRMSKTELIRAAWGNDDVEEAQLYKRVMAVRG